MITLTLDYSKYSKQIVEMVKNYMGSHEKLIPWTLRLMSDIYVTDDFFNTLRVYWDSERVSPNITYFAIEPDANVCVGASIVRYDEMDKNIYDSGNIDFGIAPAFRRQGFGTELLQATLTEAFHLGIRMPMLIANSSNVASNKIIKRAGGVINREVIRDGISYYLYGICGYARTFNYYLYNKKLRDLKGSKTIIDAYRNISGQNIKDISAKVDKSLRNSFLSWR